MEIYSLIRANITTRHNRAIDTAAFYSSSKNIDLKDILNRAIDTTALINLVGPLICQFLTELEGQLIWQLLTGLVGPWKLHFFLSDK